MHYIITITACIICLYMYITLDIQFAVHNPVRGDKCRHGDEGTAAEAQNPCDALNMTKGFPVGDRNIGCKMKNDGMQITYFVITHANV